MFASVLTVALVLQGQMAPSPVSSKNTSSSRASSAITKVSPGPELQAFRKGVLDLVNQERKTRKLALVKDNPLLTVSAQLHADDMAKRRFFSHTTPEGRSPENRIRAAGYFAPPCDCPVRFSYGENIARGQKTARDVMKAWMNSTVHRSNILKADFTEIGIGYSGGIWVQNFGSVKTGKN